MLTISMIIILAPYVGLAMGLAMNEDEGLVLLIADTCVVWTMMLAYAGILTA